MAIYNAKRIVNFFLCCDCFRFGYFILWADKILYGSEILFLEVARLSMVFSRFCFRICQSSCAHSNPHHPILTRGVILGECCHADSSYIFRHGNIVAGFRFHANLLDKRVSYSLNFVFMFSCHAHRGCLTESWVWLLIVPTPFIPS